jgi:hypothetical protein
VIRNAGVVGTLQIISEKEEMERELRPVVSHRTVLWSLITVDHTDNDIHSSAHTSLFENNIINVGYSLKVLQNSTQYRKSGFAMKMETVRFYETLISTCRAQKRRKYVAPKLWYVCSYMCSEDGNSMFLRIVSIYLQAMKMEIACFS